MLINVNNINVEDVILKKLIKTKAVVLVFYLFYKIIKKRLFI